MDSAYFFFRACRCRSVRYCIAQVSTAGRRCLLEVVGLDEGLEHRLPKAVLVVDGQDEALGLGGRCLDGLLASLRAGDGQEAERRFRSAKARLPCSVEELDAPIAAEGWAFGRLVYADGGRSEPGWYPPAFAR